MNVIEKPVGRAGGTNARLLRLLHVIEIRSVPMSSIPSAKMKHAHAHDGDHPEQAHHETHQAEAQGDQPAPPTTEKAKAKGGKTAAAGLSERAQRLTGRAEDLAEEAVDAVKSRPKTAAAIGAAIIAGAAAIIAGPAAARALRGDAEKPAPKRKSAVKKPAAKKGQ